MIWFVIYSDSWHLVLASAVFLTLKNSKPPYLKNKIQCWIGGSLQAEGGAVLLM